MWRGLVVLVQGRVMHFGIGMIRFAREFEGVTQSWCDSGEIDEEIVGSAEKSWALTSAVRGSDKYAGVMAGTKRDVGGEAGAAAGFFNDCGWIIGFVEMHPAQADAVGNPGAPHALRPPEF